jgi:orotate phosphoribosyltransferase
MKQMAYKVAEMLLEIGAVQLVPKQPVKFKSGLFAPIYIDNRSLPFYPEKWQVILAGFKRMLQTKKIDFEVVAGIEAAGIPHSAALGYMLNKPSVFCRKKVKAHGTKKMVEGGEIGGKRVLLVEDLVTTGGSSLQGAESLRQAGGVVTDCLVIVSYGFDPAINAYRQAGINLHALTTLKEIIEVARKKRLLPASQLKLIEAWHRDPK